MTKGIYRHKPEDKGVKQEFDTSARYTDGRMEEIHLSKEEALVEKNKSMGMCEDRAVINASLDMIL